MPRKQYPLEVHGVQTILDEGLEVKDMSVKELLTTGIVLLRKIELHLALITDEQINEGDVENDN